jgi:hypothetical protein
MPPEEIWRVPEAKPRDLDPALMHEAHSALVRANARRNQDFAQIDRALWDLELVFWTLMSPEAQQEAIDG